MHKTMSHVFNIELFLFDTGCSVVGQFCIAANDSFIFELSPFRLTDLLCRLRTEVLSHSIGPDGEFFHHSDMLPAVDRRFDVLPFDVLPFDVLPFDVLPFGTLRVGALRVRALRVNAIQVGSVRVGDVLSIAQFWTTVDLARVEGTAVAQTFCPGRSASLRIVREIRGRVDLLELGCFEIFVGRSEHDGVLVSEIGRI